MSNPQLIQAGAKVRVEINDPAYGGTIEAPVVEVYDNGVGPCAKILLPRPTTDGGIFFHQMTKFLEFRGWMTDPNEQMKVTRQFGVTYQLLDRYGVRRWIDAVYDDQRELEGFIASALRSNESVLQYATWTQRRKVNGVFQSSIIAQERAEAYVKRLAAVHAPAEAGV